MRKLICMALCLSGITSTYASHNFSKDVVGIKDEFFYETTDPLDHTLKRQIGFRVFYPVAASTVPDEDFNDGYMVQAPRKNEAEFPKPVQPLPLIVLAGDNGSSYYVSWFAERMCLQGGFVAALMLINELEPYTLSAVPYWKRGHDIRVFLDKFLETSYWKDRVNADRIGFAGFGKGGTIGLWLAGAAIEDEEIGTNLDNLYEPRIKGVFAMAPSLFWGLLKESNIRPIQTQIRMIVCQDDPLSPLKNWENLYSKALEDRYDLKLLMDKRSHYAFHNQIKSANLAQTPNTFLLFETGPEVDVERVHNTTATLAVNFFNKCF